VLQQTAAVMRVTRSSLSHSAAATEIHYLDSCEPVPMTVFEEWLSRKLDRGGRTGCSRPGIIDSRGKRDLLTVIEAELGVGALPKRASFCDLAIRPSERPPGTPTSRGYRVDAEGMTPLPGVVEAKIPDNDADILSLNRLATPVKEALTRAACAAIACR
jgi:hypothetical protein